MRELISFCSNGGNKQFVILTKLGAKRTDDINKFKITFNKAYLKLVINFLLNNCFFLVFLTNNWISHVVESRIFYCCSISTLASK